MTSTFPNSSDKHDKHDKHAAGNGSPANPGTAGSPAGNGTTLAGNAAGNAGKDEGGSTLHVTSPATAADKISDAVSSLGSDDEGPTAREPRYTLTIDEGVVEKISSLAAQKIDGIVDMKGSVFSMIQEGLGGSADKKGVDADVDDGTATVELSIILEYGKSAIEVFDAIKESVASQVHDMTGLDVIELTVNVVDVADKAAWDAEHAPADDDKKSERRTHLTLAQD